MTNTNYEIIQILQIFGSLICNILVKLALVCAVPGIYIFAAVRSSEPIGGPPMIPFQGPFHIEL